MAAAKVDPVLYDRIAGMLVGLALGDGLGSAHEFRYQTDKYTGKLEYKAKIVQQYQQPKYLAVGQVTDDTEMTLTLARRLIADGKYDPDKVVMDYLTWCNSGTIMLGRNTRALFKGIKTLRGYQARMAKLKQAEISQSNGSLMRCSPLAVLPGLEACVLDTDLTNPCDINRTCTQVYVAGLQSGLQGKKLSESLTAMLALAKKLPAGDTVSAAMTEEKRDVGKNKGWVLHAMHLAAQFTKYEKLSDLFQCIITQPKSDTDTNAAIAGALWGVHHGYTAMTREEVTKDNIVTLFRCDTKSADLPRQPQYTLSDLGDVVSGLAQLYPK